MPSFKSIDELEKHLATRSYVTGYSFSNDDTAAFSSLSSAPNKATHPHAYRWSLHISALAGTSVAFSGKIATTGGAAPTKAAAGKAAPAAAKEDFDDMFGDMELNEDGENAEEAAATKARHQRMEQARKLKEEKDAKDGKVKKEKEKGVEKSLVVLEVKPWEADTDLKKVWELIKEYKQDGLSWGESYKLEPVAYGIMKLVMTCTIVDSLVLMDDITENIEKLEDYVQSVTVASMNKIS